MRTVEIKFIKFCNAIIAILLALIGYACTKNPINPNNPIDPRMEYGTPWAKFIVQGKVVSVINNQAIDKIQVLLNLDTVMTDQNGNYQVTVTGFPTDQTYKVQFNDIDSTTNGLLKI
jgi:putative lipoprotein (rSAM/lipoprotein system)